MKNLFTASAFALFGVFSYAHDQPKDLVIDPLVESNRVEEEAGACTRWFEVRSCGTYWLCEDSYKDVDELFDAMDLVDELNGC